MAVAARRVHARGARGVRRAALARDEAPARPARELVGRCARAQRAPASAGLAQAGSAAVGRAPGGGPRAYAGGGGSAARGTDEDVAQTVGACARAAAQLPEGTPAP